MQHRDALDQIELDAPTEDVPRHEQGRKHRSDDTDRERDREPFDRSRTEPEQNSNFEQGRQVRVDNRAERFLVGGVNCRLQVLAVLQFLPQPFINQDVGIDRHADRQNDPGNARESENEAEERHDAKEQHSVHRQSDERDNACRPIINRHENQRGGEPG